MRLTDSLKVVDHLKQTGTLDENPRPPPLQRNPSTKSSSTSSPPPTARKVYTPPSPVHAPKPVNIPSTESSRSPPSMSPSKKAPADVRFSDRLPVRPPVSSRFSSLELSTIDQRWGMLFDNEGNPTQRLGQFLRGLANHMVSYTDLSSQDGY